MHVVLALLLLSTSPLWANTPGSNCGSTVLARPVSDLDRPEYLVMRRHLPASSRIQQNILRHVPNYVSVLLLDDREGAKTKMSQKGVSIVAAPALSNWVQDYLPETVIDEHGQRSLVSFEYNTQEQYELMATLQFRALFTGERAPKPFPQAHPIADSLARFLGWPLVKSELVLQGGHYIAAEDGMVFVSQDVRAKNQGNGLDVESELKRVLHAKQVFFLPTIPFEQSGHLDIYAMYLGERRFLLQKLGAADDEYGHYNYAVAKAAGSLLDLGYTVDYLVTPKEDMLYINSRRIGHTLFMPVFEAPSFWGKPRLNAADRAAKAKFEDLGFTVVPVPAGELKAMHGSIHCLTKTIGCTL